MCSVISDSDIEGNAINVIESIRAPIKVTVYPLTHFVSESEPGWGHVTTQWGQFTGQQTDPTVNRSSTVNRLCGWVGWQLRGRNHFVGGVCTNITLLGDKGFKEMIYFVFMSHPHSLCVCFCVRLETLFLWSTSTDLVHHGLQSDSNPTLSSLQSFNHSEHRPMHCTMYYKDIYGRENSDCWTIPR